MEGNLSQEIRLTNINETINQIDLMSKKHNEVCMPLNYIEHLPILAYAVTECVFYFCFCFFSWYSYRYLSSALVLKICTVSVRIKKVQVNN